MQATIDRAHVIAARSPRRARVVVAPAVWEFAGGWEGTLALAAIGAILGGYLGGVSVLYAWVFARQIVLDGKRTTRRRVGTALLGVASATILYSTVLSAFRLLLLPS